MTVRDRVFSAFKESFDLDDDANTSNLVYQDYPAWTSIGHMIMVAMTGLRNNLRAIVTGWYRTPAAIPVEAEDLAA